MRGRGWFLKLRANAATAGGPNTAAADSANRMSNPSNMGDNSFVRSINIIMVRILDVRE
jgi:hypothetical protein